MLAVYVGTGTKSSGSLTTKVLNLPCVNNFPLWRPALKVCNPPHLLYTVVHGLWRNVLIRTYLQRKWWLVVFSCRETFCLLVEDALLYWTHRCVRGIWFRFAANSNLFSQSDLRIYCRSAYQYNCVGRTGCIKWWDLPRSDHTSDLKPVNLECLASGLIHHEVQAYMRGWIPPPLTINHIGHSDIVHFN